MIGIGIHRGLSTIGLTFFYKLGRNLRESKETILFSMAFLISMFLDSIWLTPFLSVLRSITLVVAE
jgi:hypothetical protein